MSSPTRNVTGSTEDTYKRVRYAPRDCWSLRGLVRSVGELLGQPGKGLGAGTVVLACQGGRMSGEGSHCQGSEPSPVFLPARVTMGAHLPAIPMTAGSYRDLSSRTECVHGPAGQLSSHGCLCLWTGLTRSCSWSRPAFEPLEMSRLLIKHKATFSLCIECFLVSVSRG